MVVWIESGIPDCRSDREVWSVHPSVRDDGEEESLFQLGHFEDFDLGFQFVLLFEEKGGNGGPAGER